MGGTARNVAPGGSGSFQKYMTYFVTSVAMKCMVNHAFAKSVAMKCMVNHAFAKSVEMNSILSSKKAFSSHILLHMTFLN